MNRGAGKQGEVGWPGGLVGQGLGEEKVFLFFVSTFVLIVFLFFLVAIYFSSSKI